MHCIIFPEVCFWSDIPYGIKHLWFLVSLFLIFIPYILWIDWIKTTKLFDFVWSLVLIVFTYLSLMLSKIDINLHYSLIMMFKLNIYFHIGVMVVKYGIIEKLKKYLLVDVITLLILILFYRGLGRFALVASPMLALILTITLSVFFFKKFNNVKEVKIIAIIDYIEKNAMGIYLFHHILICGIIRVDVIYDFFITHYILGPFVLFIGSVILSIIFTENLRKIKAGRLLLGENL